MRVTTRLAVSVATVAAGASLLSAVPAAAEDGIPSAPATTESSVAAVLSAPTNLIALAGDGMATITFAPVVGATAYEYSLDGATWLPLSELTVTSASAVVSGLANGQSYGIALRALAAGTTGQPSEPVWVTPVSAAPVQTPAPAPVEAPAPAPVEAPTAIETVVPEEAPAAAQPAVADPVVAEAPAAEAPAVAEAAPAAPAQQPSAGDTVAMALPPGFATQAEYDAAVRVAVAAKWKAQAAYAAAVREAVAAKWRAQWAAYQEAVRAAVAAKWAAAYQEAVRQAVAAKWRAQAAAAAGQGSPLAQAAVANAMSRVGAAYVWGGQGPWGFDCSGLMAWAYRNAGYWLPGGSYNQIGYGWYVDYNSLRPGDLIFYGPGGSQHVAMYIGNGNVVQASNYNTGVHVASIWYIGSPTAYKRMA